MTILTYTSPARVVRRLSVDAAGRILIDAAVGPWFAAQQINTQGGSRSDDPSPRNRPTPTLRYYGGVLGPVGVGLSAGDRVGIRGTTFELIEDPRLITDGSGYTFEVPIQDVEVLYPLLGQLQEMDGTLVIATRFAAYAPRELHESRGTFEDYGIDCPIEHYTLVRTNRQFAAGDDTFKITAATVDKVGGYVSVTARKAGRG